MWLRSLLRLGVLRHVRRLCRMRLHTSQGLLGDEAGQFELDDLGRRPVAKAGGVGPG